MPQRLARKLGLFVGLSSGAVMVEALRQAQQGRRCIVGIFADDGSKYLSTGVFGM
jgi:cysteine synthase